jgi:hypothetical protein
LKLPVLIANPLATRHLPLHSPGFPLVLLYTAKAGSGSLIKWFLFHSGYLDEVRKYRGGIHQFHRGVQTRGYGWEALRLIASHERPVFKLVRNPYERAVSSFLAALTHTGDKRANSWGCRPIALARRQSGKPQVAEPALSFRDFMRFLSRNGTERGAINGHVAAPVRGGRRCLHRSYH